jgi:hypothetical protein
MKEAREARRYVPSTVPKALAATIIGLFDSQHGRSTANIFPKIDQYC